MIQFLLSRTHADVKIRLKEGTTPVNNVMVKLGEDSLLSSSLGLAKFLQLPIGQTYSYIATRENYVTKEGDFYLLTDTTIDVSMQLTSSVGFEIRSGDDIRNLAQSRLRNTLY